MMPSVTETLVLEPLADGRVLAPRVGAQWPMAMNSAALRPAVAGGTSGGGAPGGNPFGGR